MTIEEQAQPLVDALFAVVGAPALAAAQAAQPDGGVADLVRARLVDLQAALPPGYPAPSLATAAGEMVRWRLRAEGNG